MNKPPVDIKLITTSDWYPDWSDTNIRILGYSREQVITIRFGKALPGLVVKSHKALGLSWELKEEDVQVRHLTGNPNDVNVPDMEIAAVFAGFSGVGMPRRQRGARSALTEIVEGWFSDVPRVPSIKLRCWCIPMSGSWTVGGQTVYEW
jgi:hypothetical protein